MTFFDGMIEEMQNDLAKIKRDAEAAQSCLKSRGHSPGAVSKLRTQLDEMAEELLKSRQLLDIKTKGEFTHLVTFDLTWQRSLLCPSNFVANFFTEMEEVQVCLQNSGDQLLEANKVGFIHSSLCCTLLGYLQILKYFFGPIEL